MTEIQHSHAVTICQNIYLGAVVHKSVRIATQKRSRRPCRNDARSQCLVFACRARDKGDDEMDQGEETYSRVRGDF